MNYLKQINGFNRYTEQRQTVSAGAQLLYYKLLDKANLARWADWIQVGTGTLMELMSIESEKAFYKYKDELLEHGLIRWEKGRRGRLPRYHIVELSEIGELLTVKNTVSSGNSTGSSYGNNQGSNTGSSMEGSSGSNTGSNQGSNTGVIQESTLDINNINKTKLNKTKLNKTKQNKLVYPPANNGKGVSNYDEKTAYGEFKNVWLKDSEVKTLKEKYPNAFDEIVERLGNYKESSGKGYNSDYATINNWVAKEVMKDRKEQLQKRQSEMSGDQMLDYIIAGGGTNEPTGDWPTNQAHAQELPDVPF